MAKNLQFYKGRNIPLGTKVKAYFNLHKKVFSFVAVEGQYKGLVVGHAPALILDNVEFKVSKAGRERVLKEQRKNVHAYVIGELVEILDQAQADTMENRHNKSPEQFTWASYNPYKADHFYYTDSGEEITKADAVVLVNKKIRVVA